MNWEPYRHRGGVVQCSRCQRPGHGVKYCQMPPRCAFCGGEHESKDCPTTHSAAVSAAGTSQGSVRVPTPAKCCNCDSVGHFATDPNCPKRLAYIKSRQRRTNVVHQHKEPNNWPPTPHYHPNGPPFAGIVSNPGSHLSPLGNPCPPGFSSHFDSSRPSGAPHSSSNLNENPFSIEELSAIMMDIINSLRNVQFMPRHVAFKAVLDMAVKYLYKNGK